MKVSKPFIILLVASLFFGVYLVFFTGPKKTTPMGPAKPPSLPVLPQTAGNRAETSAPRPSSGDLAWGRDPFSRPDFFTQEISTKSARSALKLEAILEGERGRVAIIDKQVVVRGDAIGDEKVQEIGKDKVVLIRAGSRRLLLLGEPQKEEQPMKGKSDPKLPPLAKGESGEKK